MLPPAFKCATSIILPVELNVYVRELTYIDCDVVCIDCFDFLCEIAMVFWD